MQASIHRALCYAGPVVEGSVRDLDSMRGVDLPRLAPEDMISHGFAHLVKSNDLIYADTHGVLVVPGERAPRLADMCRMVIEGDRPLIAACQDRASFFTEKLVAAFGRFSQVCPVDKPAL